MRLVTTMDYKYKAKASEEAKKTGRISCDRAYEMFAPVKSTNLDI